MPLDSDQDLLDTEYPSSSGEDDRADQEEAEPPPEFYDPESDNRDEKWVSRLRKGRKSDAILSCPLCFTTVCIDCQQHVSNENQFRAMFVMNCKIDSSQIVRPTDTSAEHEVEKYYPVKCAVCGNELGLREVGSDGVYHFFHVVASTS